MKIHKFLLLIFLFGFFGCEQPREHSKIEEVNSTKVSPPIIEKTSSTKPIVIGKTLSSEQEKGRTYNREITSLPEQPNAQAFPIEKSPKVIEPAFTDELLKAVGNWEKIPDSVFPLKNVSIHEPVVFKLLGNNGQVMATTPAGIDKDVVVKGVVGTNLLISPSLNSKFTTKIELEKTDFKKCVAFRFEMGKKALLAQKLARAKASSKLGNQKNKKTSSSATYEKNQDNPSLVPGDFGHGKFCICSDCRQKRLALTGSMK